MKEYLVSFFDDTDTPSAHYIIAVNADDAVYRARNAHPEHRWHQYSVVLVQPF